MVNLLILQGRLTKNFVNKNNNAYSTIAVDTFKGGTMYVDVAVFGKSAEYCFNYLGKGSNVIIEGSLNINIYEDKKYVSCMVKSITNLSGKKETPQEEVEEVAEEEASVSLDDPMDDLPF